MANLQFNSNVLKIFALFVLSCLWMVTILRARKNNSKYGSRPLPSPPGLPVLGNLHQLGSHPHRSLRTLSARLGPLFLLRLGSVPTVVVSSASAAEAVLKTHDHAFCSRPPQHTARGLLYDCRDVAFSPYGEYWRQVRRIAVVHLLSAKRVASFRAIREEEVSLVVDQLHAESRKSGSSGVNVSELIVGLTNTVISKAAFGKMGGTDPAIVRATLAEFTNLLGTVAVSDLFPSLRWLDWATGLDGRVRRTARRLDEILEKVLSEHEKNGDVGDGEAHDVMDVLLSLAKEALGEFGLHRNDLKALILDLFAAGTDTVYKAIEWTMAELTKNPKEMEMVQAEVRQVAGSQGKVLEEHLEETTHLQAALKEALRLHPPVPLLVPRETIEDTQLHGYTIPAGTRVLINAWAIARDGVSWEDAEEFRPGRFLRDDSADFSGKDFRFLPFGAGRRGCPGVAFATRLAELTLASMLYHFDWELPGGRAPESFDVSESTGISPNLKSGLTLVAKPF